MTAQPQYDRIPANLAEELEVLLTAQQPQRPGRHRSTRTWLPLRRKQRARAA